jgi:hypothetical protein
MLAPKGFGGWFEFRYNRLCFTQKQFGSINFACPEFIEGLIYIPISRASNFYEENVA